jgi:hypothetical protein
MKLARTGVIAAAVLSIATMAFAQAKPDFSGTWAPDQAAAPAGTGGGGGQGGGGGRGMGGGPMVVKQDASTLTITRTMGENSVVQTYKLDGTESENKMAGRGGAEMVTKSTAKWDGSKLTIATKSTGPDGAERVQNQTWSLEGGNLVIERAGRDGAMMKTVYKKTT